MLTRFLIVILAILNVGVALWWMVPRAEPAKPVAKAEPGVATLELLPSPAAAASQEAGAASANAVADAAAPPASAAPSAATTPAGTKPAEEAPAAKPEEAAAKPTEVAAAPAKPALEHCVSLGPFADQAKARAALATLGGDVLRPRVREVPGKAGSSYRVLIPPAASREEAQAMAKRIVAAGFSDYFIVSQGEEANAVALGQYRNREGAERRLAALVAAGFPAKLVGNGSETPASWWLDVAYTSATPASLMQRAGAGQQQSLDCARLR